MIASIMHEGKSEHGVKFRYLGTRLLEVCVDNVNLAWIELHIYVHKQAWTHMIASIIHEDKSEHGVKSLHLDTRLLDVCVLILSI